MGRDEESQLRGTAFLWGEGTKMSKIRLWGWLHKSVKVLKRVEFYTLNGELCGM